MSVVRNMFCGSFGMQNAMVAFVFRFDLRKGQYKVKLGKKGQLFNIKKNLLKSWLSCPVCSQDSPKIVIYFYVRHLEMPKIAFQKTDITFTWHLDHCTAKYKDIALVFGICVVCMQLYKIYSVFINKKWFLQAFIFQEK